MLLWTTRERIPSPKEIAAEIGVGSARFGPSQTPQTLAEQIHDLPQDQRHKLLELRKVWHAKSKLTASDDGLYHDMYLLCLNLCDFDLVRATVMLTSFHRRHEKLTLAAVQPHYMDTQVRSGVLLC